MKPRYALLPSVVAFGAFESGYRLHPLVLIVCGWVKWKIEAPFGLFASAPARDITMFRYNLTRRGGLGSDLVHCLALSMVIRTEKIYS